MRLKKRWVQIFSASTLPWISCVTCSVIVWTTFCVAVAQSEIDKDESLHIRTAFIAMHNGWSVDEVLMQDELRAKFVNECRKRAPSNKSTWTEKQWLQRLVQIRKADKLNVKTTKRSNQDLDIWLPIAEIASRQMMDLHGANIDQWLCDPDLLNEFDTLARSVGHSTGNYEIRKAAMQLRKSRRLQPELMARVVDWKREIQSMSLEEAINKISQLPTNPGIYIFRDPTGYLYIGQSNNLKGRLTKHLDNSDRKALSHYLKSNTNAAITLELHIFASDSPATQTVVREAYESELIRTRQPRLNIAP